MLTSACIATLLVAAPAPETPTLAWKFKEGDVFYLRTQTAAKQIVKVMGNEIMQNQEHLFVYRYTVKTVKRDGSIVIEQKIEDASLKLDVGGGKAIGPQFRGTTMTFTLNSRHQVVSLEGYQEFLKAFPEEYKAANNVMLTEDAIKQSLGERFSIFPGKSVAVGDKWERKSRMELGPVGAFDMTSNYRYVDRKKTGGKTLDNIEWTSELRYLPPPPAAQGQQQQPLPYKITKGTLKTEDYKGTLLFDPQSGRVHQSSASYRTHGQLTIEIGGMETQIDLDQHSSTKTTLVPKP